MHPIRALKFGYRPYGADVSISVPRGERQPPRVLVTDLHPIQVYGVATDEVGEPVPNATIQIAGFPEHQAVTDALGGFRLENLTALPVGEEYRLEAKGREGYHGLNSFLYEGAAHLRCNLTLAQVPWTEILQESLRRNDCKAVVSNLSVDRLSAPDIQSTLSPILGYLDEVLNADPENFKTLVYAGIVADRLDSTD